MAAFRPLAAALAAVSLVNQVHAWTVELPPCTSPFQPFVYSGCYQDSGNPPALSFRSSLDSQNMTVEICVAECKGNGYRYAGLEYYGECFCGQTVDGPQLSDSACTFPCTGNSSEICGGNNIISVWQDTTFPSVNTSTISDYVPLGCWTDDSSIGRALAYPQDNLNASAMTTEACLEACKEGGFPFAGTEYQSQCWCGVVIGNGTNAAPASDCSMTCTGNAGEICGGPARLSLYVAQDLESLQPCGYTPPVSSSSSSSSSSTSSSSTTSSASSTSSTAPVTTSTTCTTSTTSSSSSSTSTSSKAPVSSTSTTCTTSSKGTTTAPPTTSKPVSTTSTSSLCTSTVTIPSTCEYGCGNWCSGPLPDWNEQTGCQNSCSNCKLQVAACFQNAGWPAAMDCFDFAGWCSNVGSYCTSAGGSKGGLCSKSDCFNKQPPSGGKPPTTTTTVFPCKATTSSSKPTTTSSSKCPIPTPTGICTQPSSWTWGYSPGNPVGGIQLPVVTCNNLASTFGDCPFKLYNDTDTSKCGSYPRGGVPNACADACKIQYNQCTNTYAQGCKGNGNGQSFTWGWKRATTDYFSFAKASPKEKRTITWTDSYSTANSKCQAQYNDCLSCNKGTTGSGKCSSWGSF